MTNEESSTKWIHFIGISGVTMAPLANAFKEKGYFVTGSDKAFYPPISSYLVEKAITIEVGFKPEHLTKHYYETREEGKLNVSEIPDQPDIVVIGASISTQNKELIHAKEKGLNLKSYPEVLEEYEIVKGNSIVVTGSFGKTTITALLVHIFKTAGKKISYMFGGVNPDFDSVELREDDTEWSITEGDEYATSPFDRGSKFFHYHPNHLIVTSAAWDHTDLFKTEDDFVQNFQKLVEQMPRDGLIVASKNGTNMDKVLENTTSKIIPYEYDEKEFEYEENLIGDHNRENILAAATMARNLDIPTEAISKAIRTFSGIKRRLEVRLRLDNTIVVDDFGSTPQKAKASIQAVTEEFKGFKIIVIFEPNAGNRTKDAASLYDNVFEKAERIIIPRLTFVKSKEEDRFSETELVEIIRKTHKNVEAIQSDSEIINQLTNLSGKNVIMFMGSRGFRGMIEQVIERLS